MTLQKELYSKILGLKGEFSTEQLKHQYRKRVKILHPDQNKHPRSHEQFLLLQEAYAFYLNLLEKEQTESPSNPFNSKKYPKHYQKEPWKFNERKVAQERAARRARLRDEEYHKLGYYKLIDRMFYFMDIMRFFLALFIVFVAPIALFLLDGIRGLLICLFVQVITYPIWMKAIKKFISIP